MSTTNCTNIYVNAFNQISGIGPQKLYLLASYFNSFENAWNANATELENAGLTFLLSQKIITAKTKIDPQKEWDKLQKNNIQLITIQDNKFPKKLKTIPSPPFLLYVRGNVDILNHPSVAVVGSRKITDYGKHAITSIISDIARAGVVIVSGLALGTDSLAHHETLQNNGTTVAVLAGGIDDATITPRTHFNLAKQILTNDGTIISEYPIKTQPTKGTYPTRNRIMAGLTDATIIIEATQKSGTLITANYTCKFKRNLFAVPGSIFADNSAGPNMLLRDKKATPLLCSDDVMYIFKDIFKDTHKSSGRTCLSTTLSGHQKTLYQTIKKHPEGVQINKISKETKLDTSTISSELTMMEIDGIVKNIGNQVYVLVG